MVSQSLVIEYTIVIVSFYTYSGFISCSKRPFTKSVLFLISDGFPCYCPTTGIYESSKKKAPKLIVLKVITNRHVGHLID